MIRGMAWAGLGGLVWLAAMSAAPDSPAPAFDYVDIAAPSGLTVRNTYGKPDRKDYILETTGNGAAIFDFDNDGANDIFIANGARLEPGGAEPLPQLYRNDGKGRFTDIARQAGFRESGWAQGVCAGDYDNDGWTDLLVTYYGYNRLYRNRGDGTFENVTRAAGLPVTGTRWGSGCAFLDYDKDGHLDFFVANYVDLDLKATPKPGDGAHCQWKGIPVMCGPRGLPMAKNVLYRNNGDGTFTDVSEAAGILKPGGRYGLGVVAADFDNDSWTDIYVGCDMTPSLYYRNRGDGTFEEIGLESGAAVNFDGQLQAGMGVAVADYDGNGLLDIAKTNFAGDLPSLYNNEDGRFFTDVSHPAGLGAHQLLGWGIAFIDADEDGWPDLVMANGHVYPEVSQHKLGDTYLQKTLFYRNLGDGRFEDWTARAGNAFAQPRASRGLAAGDLNGDGHPEIVIVNMNDLPALLENRGPRRNAAVVSLKGTKSNRSAIGARVTVEAGGRARIQDVTSGGSYYSQHDFALHFGLETAAKIDRLTVRWPSGETQQFAALPVNHRLEIVEGATEPKLTPLEGRGAR